MTPPADKRKGQTLFDVAWELPYGKGGSSPADELLTKLYRARHKS